MEPDLSVDPSLAGVLEELKQREPIFHHPELGTTRADFERQTAPDFWEVGATGRRYSREYIWSVLEKRWSELGDDPWETSAFHCRQVSPDTYLLTYTLLQEGRRSRRLTVWQKTSDGWQIVYHQGTVVE